MIVGYEIESRGFIFCLRCYNRYIDDRDTPDNIKEEFEPIRGEFLEEHLTN